MPREMPLTKERIALVDDEDFEWLSQWKWTASIGKHGHSYASRRVKNKTILMHRLITAAPADMDVDHIDGNGLNNQRNNLRVCTTSQNLHNQGKPKGVRTSQYKGVYLHPVNRKWVSQIRIPLGKVKNLGSFSTEEAAAHAFDAAARRYHGEFARLNFPLENDAAA